MANRRFNQFYNTLHKMPVQLDCNFIVDSTNGNGLGIRSLKGAGIENVFMHTSSTPGVGNGGFTNPNPSAGNIIVQFEDNYNYYIGGYGGFGTPLTGTNINVDASDAALTIGVPYVIVSLGTSTAADWVTVGVPVGTLPAVGVAFIAAATGAGTGTGKVQAANAIHSNVGHVEVLGDPNQTITSSIGALTGSSTGPYAIFKCIGSTFVSFTGTTHTSTTVDTLSSLNGLRVGQVISGTGIPLGTTITAVGASSITLSAAATASASGVAMTAGPYEGLVTPTNNTVVGMTFVLSNSNIQNQGY